MKKYLPYLAWTIVAIIVALGIALYLGIKALGAVMCGTDLLEKIPSPNGKKEAVVFVVNCGATTDWSVQVSVEDSGYELNNSARGNVFVSDGDHGAAQETNEIGGPLVKALWKDNDNLEIQYSPGTRIFKQAEWYRDSLGVIHVTYKESKLGSFRYFFENTCDQLGQGGATFGNAKTLEELIDASKPVKTNPDGTDIHIIPCGQGAYQSWFVPVLYDGSTYTPLTVPIMNEQREITYEPYGIEMGYNADVDIFTSTARLSGAGVCWYSGEYKYVDQKLVLQKFTAQWDCGIIDPHSDAVNGQVMFPIAN